MTDDSIQRISIVPGHVTVPVDYLHARLDVLSIHENTAIGFNAHSLYLILRPVDLKLLLSATGCTDISSWHFKMEFRALLFEQV
jgi:hypothetical protein